ncbi:MAG: response regulator transcription factor [Hyphomonas sp.]
MRLLLIDDDPLIGKTVRLGWPNRDDTIEVCRSYAQAKPIILSARLQTFDCVILDLNLPDATGASVLAQIRQNSRVPVVMLSGWGDADFRAQLLTTGADDYIMKPVGIRELHARVQNLTRRSALELEPKRDKVRILIGAIQYDPLSRRFLHLGESVELTQAENGLVDAMVSANGEIVHRDELYQKAFGRSYREGEKVLETYIGRLRQKLSDMGEEASARLLTVRGVGYRLVFEVQPDAEPEPDTGAVTK